MKKIISVNLILLVVFVASSFSVSTTLLNDKNVIGTWEYNIPEASYEYQNGKLIIEKKEGKLTGHFLSDAENTTIEKVSFEENKLSFIYFFDTEGQEIELTFNLTIDKDKFRGSLSTPEGSMSMTGVKKK
uniref:Secreted protein n=1 Tax=uncultured Flavobacteriia bacterium TaxID=212695 RepID=H6RE50_9BACT|nr:hypothetical protein [uncultured bacterium]CCF99311.1 conserved hypothetical protein [uncultured Flavobacteriia bacterium]|tara:strand:+ start:335 stop:724 length:390 start_codon:yes stop_codon:yes gene_type:complete